MVLEENGEDKMVAPPLACLATKRSRIRFPAFPLGHFTKCIALYVPEIWTPMKIGEEIFGELCNVVLEEN